MHLNFRWNPFGHRGGLLAPVVSVDDSSAAVFGEDDVVELVAEANSGNQFDGDTAVVLRLRDGRCAAFDCNYASYAGDDFSDGTAIIYVGASIDVVVGALSAYGQARVRAALARG